MSHKTFMRYLTWSVAGISILMLTTASAWGTGYLRTDPRTFFEVMWQTHFGNPCIGVQTVTNSGAQLTYMQPGAPAEANYLQVGDRIVAVNGKRVEDSDDLSRLIRLSHPGEVIGIKVRRGDFLGIRDTLSWGIRLGYYKGETCVLFPLASR